MTGSCCWIEEASMQDVIAGLLVALIVTVAFVWGVLVGGPA